MYGSVPVTVPPFTVVPATDVRRTAFPVSAARSDAPVKVIGFTDIVEPMFTVPATGQLSVGDGGAVHFGPLKGVVWPFVGTDAATRMAAAVAAPANRLTLEPGRPCACIAVLLASSPSQTAAHGQPDRKSTRLNSSHH